MTWITANKTNKLPALNGDRKDLKRKKLAIPITDESPTIIVIAISIDENCPLSR